MEKIIIILILIVLLVYLKVNEKFVNPCKDFLSDTEFLEHMIPHHQVAIDMSVLLQPISKSPIMQELFRKIIWQQNYEIEVMNSMINKLPDKISYGKMRNYYQKSKLSFYFPKKTQSVDGECDPLFFKPNDHMEHMKHMKINDKSYLEHMIPHHQVAVDMCKRLLIHTKNNFLISLCYDIIREQELEILKMNELLENVEVWNYQSNLLY
tara:strand:+ start:1360 stop:1986 length:627 start_codon:yes stop_codon:yes gene_type:complete